MVRVRVGVGVGVCGLEVLLARLGGAARPNLLEERVLRHGLLQVRPRLAIGTGGREQHTCDRPEVALRVALVILLGAAVVAATARLRAALAQVAELARVRVRA